MGMASPASARASSSARAAVRFATRKAAGRRSANCCPARRAVSPAPTTSTWRPPRSLKTLPARATAAEATETVPAPISVSVRARLPARSAVVTSRSRTLPRAPSAAARASASLTWPRISASPRTIDSRPDATRSRWRAASSSSRA